MIYSTIELAGCNNGTCEIQYISMSHCNLDFYVAIISRFAIYRSGSAHNGKRSKIVMTMVHNEKRWIKRLENDSHMKNSKNFNFLHFNELLHSFVAFVIAIVVCAIVSMNIFTTTLHLRLLFVIFFLCPQKFFLWDKLTQKRKPILIFIEKWKRFRSHCCSGESEDIADTHIFH